MRPCLPLCSLGFLTWPPDSSELLLLPQSFCDLPRSPEKISLHTCIILRRLLLSEGLSLPWKTWQPFDCPCAQMWETPVRLLFTREPMRGTLPSSTFRSSVCRGFLCVSLHQKSLKCVRTNFVVNFCFLSQLPFAVPQLRGLSLVWVKGMLLTGLLFFLILLLKWTLEIYYRSCSADNCPLS